MTALLTVGAYFSMAVLVAVAIARASAREFGDNEPDALDWFAGGYTGLLWPVTLPFLLLIAVARGLHRYLNARERAEIEALTKTGVGE